MSGAESCSLPAPSCLARGRGVVLGSIRSPSRLLRPLRTRRRHDSGTGRADSTKLRRFSRAPQQGADSIIAACITNTRHSLEAPLGSAVESWPPQPSACPPPSPHAVPCVGDASCERRESRAGARRRSKRRRSFLCETTTAPDPQRDAQAAKSTAAALVSSESGHDVRRSSVLGVAGKELLQHFSECGSRVQLGKDGQPAQPHSMNQ